MKKNSIAVVALLLFLLNVNANADSLKKVFFDRNYRYVEFEEFAAYYRLEIHSEDPTAPIPYRLFNISGKLLAEGTATKLDNKDYTKCEYIGENIIFFDNGNIAEKFVLDTPGPLSNANYYESYDESGNVLMKGSQNNGLFTGEKTEFDDDGYYYHYFVRDNIPDGEARAYNQDGLVMTTFYKNGIEEGERIFYYPSGRKYSSCEMVNGLKNGEFVFFDENGRVKSREYYKKGVPVGVAEYGLNDPTIETTRVEFIEMESSDEAPFFISAEITKREYMLDNRWVSKSGWVERRDGKMVSGYKGHCNILRYDLYIQNLSDEDVTISLDSIKVLTYTKKKNNRALEDIYIDEGGAHEICSRHLALERQNTYESAVDNAKTAAKTTSSTVSISESGYYNKDGGITGYAALLGVGRRGVATTSNVASTSFNNGVYNQVLESEMSKANSYLKRQKEDTMDEIERLRLSNIIIPAKSYVQKEVMASEDLSDIVVLSFEIQGYKFRLEFED